MRADHRVVAGLIASTFGVVVACSPLVAQNPVVNPDMEQGVLGGPPTGWHAPVPSYAVELVGEGAHGGKQAVRVSNRATPGPNEFGNVMQSLDATPFRGATVRLRAYVRVEQQGTGWTGLWLRVDRAPGELGFFDNMNDRPIRSAEWQPYEITGTVSPDARRIAFGMLLSGSGRAWLDDVSLEVVGRAEPPRPLSDRGLANEIAFTRLLGYVRFFHPSDESAAADWNRFAIAGARAVEPAENARRLAAMLDSLFRPLAPTVSVFAGESAPRHLAAPVAADVQVVMWQHRGVGLIGNGGGAYQSRRIRAPASALADSFISPAAPLRVSLGGGVSASIPLAVYADSAGTLPRGTPMAADSLARLLYTADDRGTRLADVALAWTVFQHFYPYFDVAGTDWAAELPKALQAAATDADAAAFQNTLRRMVAALKDGHGNVSSRVDARNSTPPVLLGAAEGKVVVVAVAPGVTDLRPGDVVERVDDRPVAEVLARDEALISGATPQWVRFRSTRELLLGARDSQVAVDVTHLEGSRERGVLKRGPYSAVPTEKRPAAIAELRPSIWYVDLGRVTAPQVDSVLPKLVLARGLILDMRGYPTQAGIPFLAHLSRTPLHSAQWNIPIVTRPDRQGMRFDLQGWDLMPRLPYLTAKRVFLTDGRAISQAETLLGIVENYKLGDTLGEPTAGTNGNINPFEVPGRLTIVWTGMKVLKHDGSRHHGVGILPTVPVSRTVAGIAAGRDEQLERALELVDVR